MYRKFALLLPLLALTSCVTDQAGVRGSNSQYGSYYAPPGSYAPPTSYSPSQPQGRPVHISDAAYRAPDGRQCDARRALRSMCDGEESCRVTASNDLCGDPANGVGKKLVIGYKCGDGRVEVTVQEHKSVSLSCPR
ncbi:MAG: hypothetical protein JWM77_1866 [Rhodospirillales bacterium]|jgi:hypothetical protein|nr:hypothetical protein [Rhodospirillales bacterium]